MRVRSSSALVLGVIAAFAGMDGACGSNSGSSGPVDAGKVGDGSPHDGSGVDGTTTDSSIMPGGDSGISGRDTAPPPSGSVVQHHNDGYRDGRYVDDIFTHAAAATTHVVATFGGAVNGNVYAQPLWVENGPNGAEAFLVATENNHVTAIGADGNVIWDKGYGPAVPLGSLPCGNIDPLGITGTPYIDLGSRTIYFDEMTSPDHNNTLHHLVYAVSLDDGTVKANWPVDVGATVTDFDSGHQNERGALQLVNGVLYVPYGGHDGDCDPYFGWVVGVPTNNPQHPKGWHTNAARGGIWGPGSLPTDGTSVFPVTGNTEGTSTWGGGEAILRITAGPAFSGASKDYYAPSDWKSLDDSDTDLGAANDFLLDMPGAPHPHLIIAGGKDDKLYILDRDTMGGVGGELSKTTIATSEIMGAGATFRTSKGTFVALYVEGGTGTNCPDGNSGNIVVVSISPADPPTPTIVWCSKEQGLDSPIVTTTDGTSNAILWAANDHLWAFDAETGAELFDGSATQMSQSGHKWNTPIDTKGRIAVAANGQLYIFTP